jgi:WD40 repeat protein/serine/threonine protein kinase
MNERAIFIGALDREDAAARAAYLDEACAGKPALRRRVEQLLRSHQNAEDFLEVPAVEQLANDEQFLAVLTPSSEPKVLGLLDHYEALEVLGRGATGVVFKARDTKLQRIVAIKVLAPRLAASSAARRRFVREAQAAAAIRDDHVIGIHAVHDDGPLPYLVMEYIPGITLADRIKRGGPAELTEVLRVGLQAAKGLAAAHAQGLIHRDIKPGNILLENGVQRVKISDFGLALSAAEAGLADNGGMAGTPSFMSPEQARGEPTDYRTDLFSLGSVLYTLCTGRPPFQGDSTVAVLQCVRENSPQPIRELNPTVPDWLCDLIQRLQAKPADHRPATAQEVADLLGRQLALLQQSLQPMPTVAAVIDPPATDRGAPRPSTGAPSPRSRFFALCLAGLLLTVAALAASRKWRPDPAPGDVPSRPSGQPSAASFAPLELQRERIPLGLMTLAGGGDPRQAPPELAAVLGDGRFLMPRVGSTGFMCASPDGKLLAVPLDEDVVFFEAPTGRYLRSLKGPGGRVICVSFSRDSRLLAATTRSAEVGGAARVWDLRADRVLFTKPQVGRKVSGALAFSADGKRLFTEGHERLHVWDSISGREVQSLDVRPGGIGSMCFSPDGRRLAVAAYFAKSVKVFDWDGDKLTEVRSLAGHRTPVWGVVYSPDGKFLASGDGQGLKLWSAQTLDDLCTFETSAEQLAFAPDSRTLFATTTTEQHKSIHTFTCWDVVARHELSALPVEVAVEPVRAFHCLSHDGKVLYVSREHDATHVTAIDTATGKQLFPRRGHVAPLHVVSVSPDGRTAASAGEDWVVKLWDLATGEVRHSLVAHMGAVCGLAFSPDGRQLASGSRDGTIALWDVDAGTEIRALHGHSRLPSRIQFSPDGKLVAAGGETGAVKLWEVATGKEQSPLMGHVGAVRCVAFSPDGAFLASGSEDKSVCLHNLGTGGRQRLKAPNAVNAVAFSSDGRTLAMVGDAPEAAVVLRNLDTGHETTWRDHGRHVLGLAFAPSAPLLATSAEDGEVRLWDLTGTGSRVRTMGPGPFGGGVRSVAFTPDGRYLCTANANGMVYVLRVEGSALVL